MLWGFFIAHVNRNLATNLHAHAAHITVINCFKSTDIHDDELERGAKVANKHPGQTSSTAARVKCPMFHLINVLIQMEAVHGFRSMKQVQLQRCPLFGNVITITLLLTSARYQTHTL